MSLSVRPWPVLLAALATSGCTGFFGPPAAGPMHASLYAVSQKGDALALSDALEVLIADGKDTPTDREFALKTIVAHQEDTAAYAFARAAVAGRVAQSRKGLGSLGLIGDVARWAEVSRKLDPNFREGAATRMLGQLYTQAPAAFLPNGANAEAGLDLLDALVRAHPNTPENHLRLAEALVFQSDVASAVPHLCWCQAHRGELRRDDQALLDKLFQEADNPTCPNATAPKPAAAPPPASVPPASAPPASAPAPAPPRP
jgi:hypothetical protein